MPNIVALEVMCAKDHMDVHMTFSHPFEGIVSSKGNKIFVSHEIELKKPSIEHFQVSIVILVAFMCHHRLEKHSSHSASLIHVVERNQT
jgi:hypothetical protein